MSRNSTPVYVRSVRFYLSSLLITSGLAVGVVYIVSSIFPSIFSEQLVFGVLIMCSLVLLLTAVSFASKEVATLVSDREWLDIKISVLALTLVILSISGYFGYKKSEPLYLESVYVPFVSLSLLTILFITTDKMISLVFGRDTLLDFHNQNSKYSMLTRESSRVLDSIVTSQKVDSIVELYGDDEKKFLLKEDVEDEIFRLIRDDIKNSQEQIPEELDLGINQFCREIKENKDELMEEIVREHNLDGRLEFMVSQKNIELLSRKCVYLGELKEYTDDDPTLYLDEISSIIGVETSRDDTISPENVETKIRDSSVAERVSLARFVMAEEEKQKQTADESDAKVSWYIEKLEDTTVI